MRNVILFGATGAIGQEIARELSQQGYRLRVVARNEQKAKQRCPLADEYRIADATLPATLAGICQGQDIVISALGKAVSPQDKSKASFQQVDFNGNVHILNEARAAGVKKFVYVSAFHAEKYPHLAYCRAHHDFSERLKASGLDYSILKPPAVFSAFAELIPMARKGQLLTIGAGDRKTNPIYEGDLARLCVASIGCRNATLEAGGKAIYSRKQLNELVQQAVNPRQKVRQVPAAVFRAALPALKLFNRNMYDKLAFFLEVTQQDTLAPQRGEMRFEDYLQRKVVP